MRKSEFIANLMLMFGLPFLVVPVIIYASFSIVGLFPQICYWATLLFFLLGFGVFLKAKLSLIKQGNLFTFGIKGMSKINQVFYTVGYILMLSGFIFMIGILLYCKLYSLN